MSLERPRMAERFTFTVFGTVVGSARPRVTRNGTYIPAKTRRYRQLLRSCYREQGGPVFSGPLRVTVEVFRELPKSRPKYVVAEPDTFKPDVDNVGKNVLDALNGLAWGDDASVTDLRVRKHPRTRCSECVRVTIEPDV